MTAEERRRGVFKEIVVLFAARHDNHAADMLGTLCSCLAFTIVETGKRNDFSISQSEITVDRCRDEVVRMVLEVIDTDD